MIKFELREKFEQQGARFAEITSRYQEAVIEAGTRLADLKAEQEALLRQEFTSGDDLSAEKTKVRENIEEAERAVKAAETDSRRAHEYARAAGEYGRITVRDITKEWNGPYRTQVREQELQPIIDRMTEARAAYLNSVLDYYGLIDEYADLYREISEGAYHDRQADGYLSAREIATISDLPRVTEDDLSLINQYRKLPDGVKRTATGGKGR